MSELPLPRSPGWAWGAGRGFLGWWGGLVGVRLGLVWEMERGKRGGEGREGIRGGLGDKGRGRRT